MYITCKCLNVTIRTRGNDLKAANVEDFELNPIERVDVFFREKLATITDLEGITKEQSGLVEVRNVGSWFVHYCYNCSEYTHAIHKEHGAALVLINTNIIMASDEVEKLKASSNWSPVFRIVIDRDTLDGDFLQPPTKFSVSQLSRPLQTALAGLQQQLEEGVQKKSTATEEKIRAFTAEQYQLLEQFRERAHAEHTLLARLICNSEDGGKSVNNAETPPTNTPDRVRSNTTNSIAQSMNLKSPAVGENHSFSGTLIRHHAATKHPSHLQMIGSNDSRDKLKIFSNEPTSYDDEAMFPLEGMDDGFALEHQLQPSEDESDADGHDEGMHIPRAQRGGHPTLAKSLPVTVPAFPSYVRRNIQDDDDDQLSRDPLDPHNIRASIKALAKSVHGDTVFGDLPRPRFSTQI